MAKGWGYKNHMSFADRIRTSKTVKFESDTMKVYEYSWNDSSTYFNDVTIKYIVKKDTKKKTIIFSGFHKPMNYDVSEFKNQKDIFNHVANVLFVEYFNYNRKLEDEYFDNKEVVEAETVQEVKETETITTQDTTVKSIDDTKENNLKVNSKEDIYNYIQKLIGTETDINKIEFSWNGWDFKSIHSKIIEEKPRNIFEWETVFYNDNVKESIKVNYITRLIKAKDQLVLKSIEGIEVY